MALSASASATTLTSPAGTAYTGPVKAETEGEMIVHEPLIESRCKSTFEWTPTSHGASVTVKGPVTAFYLTECSAGTTVFPVKLGTFEVHTRTEKADANGTLTWTGAEITSQTHAPIGTIDCLYGIESGNSHVGVITGSTNTGTTAKVDMEVTLVRVGGSPFCPVTSKWTAAYKITTPDNLNVD
jgi:hypothetical protein